MSNPAPNPDSTSHSSTDNRPLAPPGPPNPDIKAPDAATFEIFHPTRLTQSTKLKTERADLVTAIATLRTRITALKENSTEPMLSRAARRSALSKAHIDLRKAQRKL
jgi:hypothetical protein